MINPDVQGPTIEAHQELSSEVVEGHGNSLEVRG